MFPVVAAGATLGTSTAREALEQLYASAHGAKWRASTRWLSGNVCRWHGIDVFSSTPCSVNTRVTRPLAFGAVNTASTGN